MVLAMENKKPKYYIVMRHMTKLMLHLIKRTKKLIKNNETCFLTYLFILISTNGFSQKITYKGLKDSHINESFILNFNDSTYIYNQNSEEGCAQYKYKSNGKFTIHQDTLMLISKMPDNESLQGHIHNLTSTEINKNKFNYIYPTDDIVEKGFIKIYFDNIAKPDKYRAYTLSKDKLTPLKIKSFVKLEKDSILKTEKSSIRLLNYLIIEKPKNNILIIDSKEDWNTSQSYLFDFSYIPFNSFHFYTRVYSTYYDFTGLKFIISNHSRIRLIKDEINRYEFNKISSIYNEIKD
jgi:hypothetical protein